ncbi:ATP-binding protein [Aquabacterium sp. J223]|uniref:ATP-binding response regulator n=1 Tax=Aquabacterium sp. J223 TaxID=2898431 RepID=UPI0021AE1E73|nr:ATP-binding protein [Aquabacterium sp. J223]UUX95064.1 response regulator [Aquabacterium sp. J223]
MEHRVLIHAPLGRDSALTARVLAGAGIDSTVCDDEAALLTALSQGAGALLLVEESLAGGALQQAVTDFLAQQPPWSDLPVLVMTKPGANSEEAQRATRRLGNVTLLERPVRLGTLVTSVRSALRARERQYQVRTLNRRKDEFLATLAHELRNPLAPIRNAMGIVERLHPTDQVRSLADMVQRQVDHLKRLVDDLLDVARITSGKLELQPGLTSVQRVIAHAVEITQADLTARGHRLTVDQPAEEVPLQADAVRLVQSLANLLGNASKFTPPGGHIELQATVQPPQVEFTVRDNGKGIDPALLEDIFEMFVQAQPRSSESGGGLGLGLHLTRAFARLHGGDVWARSGGPGQGSEFMLRLPVVAPSTASATAPAPAPPPAEGSPLPARVLVVDDNPDAADTLQTLLGLHGVEVIVARDGAEAVSMACSEHPDAVVMDIGMPVMDGYEAARAIRSRLASPPVLIALTGWGQQVDKQRAADAGFDHHFVKPLALDELLGCLAHVAEPVPAPPA